MRARLLGRRSRRDGRCAAAVWWAAPRGNEYQNLVGAEMTDLAIVSCVVSMSLLISAALDAGTREEAALQARRAAMQAEIDHACQQPD